MGNKTKAGWEFILFPLFLINITTSANTWEVLGISIGQIFYYVIIAIATFIILTTPYRTLGLVLLGFSFLFLFLYIATKAPLVDGLKVASLGGLFLLAGAKIYGTNPTLLYKHLAIFFALCIPVMLCQIIGVSSFFMYWSTDYAHDTAILDISEIGTFKVIPVYPTLFVGSDDIYYQIGQGRPSGLLHANNILSIFIAIGVGVNMITSRSTKFRYSDFAVIGILTLAMSFMAFAVTILLYVYCILLGGRIYRIRAIKLLVLFSVFLFFYYLLFPGLFMINFGEAKFLTSVITRGVDLATSLGFSGIKDLYSDQIIRLGDSYHEDTSYSQFAILLKSKFVILIGIVLGFVGILYLYGFKIFRKETGYRTLEFNIVLFCCIFTQFGVPYLGAPAYQFILGFALYPMLRRFWVNSRLIKYNYGSNQAYPR
jgi:hypothetical protein